MKFYIYVFILLIMFAAIIKTAGLSVRAPRKIRAAGIVVCFLAFLRYAALAVFLTADNIIFLYILKPLVYLQYIFIPVVVFSTIYIVLKKSRFSCVLLTLTGLIILYAALILSFKANLEYVQGWGYVMNLQCQYFIDWIYFAFNTFIFLGSLVLLKPKNAVMIKLSSAVSMIELLMKIYSIPLLINPVLGELLWFITFAFSINKIKKQV